jgi:tetratricopeptide (TPR) repeat protein
LLFLDRQTLLPPARTAIAPLSQSTYVIQKYFAHTDWLQLREGGPQRIEYTAEAAEVILSSIRAYSDHGAAPWQRQELLMHMDECMMNDQRYSRVDHQMGQALASCHVAAWFAHFYRQEGRYGASEALLRVACDTQTRTLGKEYPDTLASMNNLAGVLSRQGKYEEAEEMHREALRLRETVLGTEHPSTPTSMNNLATVLSHQGKYEEAEKMHRDALGLSEKVLGKEHPYTLTSMNNLAGVLGDQGKYEEAEKLHQTH